MNMPDWFVRLQRWPIGLIGEALGTRSDTDPQARAARRWLRRLLKVECEQLAVFTVLMDKGVISKAEYLAAIQRAAQTMCLELEREFPGMRAREDGVDMDIKVVRETTRDWPR